MEEEKQSSSQSPLIWLLLLVIAAVGIYFLFTKVIDKGEEKSDMDGITLQLKWVEQGQFMGFLVAEKLGYYEEENIDIDILPGGVGINPVDVLIAGHADIAVAWTGNVLPAISLGEELVNIGQGMQRSGIRLMAFKENGVESPADITGKSIGTWPGGNELEPYAFIEKQGLDRDRDVVLVNQNFDMNQLLNGEIDIASATIYNEYWLPIEAGYDESEFTVFDMEDEGVAMLQDALFVKREYLEENEDLLVRFLKATIKGWEYAIQNPEDAIERIDLDFIQGDETAKKHHIRMGVESGKLYKADDGSTKGLFYINKDKLQQTVDIATKYIDEVKDIDTEKIYTLSIWEKATKDE
ncbi:MAG: ABC transporter substrate-binding protein [Candidatus Dojkabacteria bacterium]|jgi:NitT/TauT family transport system substrate-binding protein